METLRRKYLNNLLAQIKLNGKVIDIGGQKVNKRSDPNLNKDQITEFLYLNTDEKTMPDILASAEKIPKNNNHFDNALLIEVIEHLENPSLVLIEVNRVLKENGTLFLSIPFLNSIHADPYDFQRWTPTKINLELKKAGFSNIEITAMGGFYAVINDLIRFRIYKTNKLSRKFLKYFYNYFIKTFFEILDRIDKKTKDYMTTGYFIVCKKN